MGLELSRIFVKVIQYGGFSKAATALNMPKSTVSKAITRLESETGTKLLIRTTRSQTLTAAGRLFYEACLGPIQTLEDAQKSLYGMDNIVTGLVKLTAPEDMGIQMISPAIGKLCLKYPRLKFEMNYTDEIIDLVRDGYDFGIRVGELKESSLRSKRLGNIEMIPVASPTYLKSKKKLKHPKDLEDHIGLNLGVMNLSTEWTFKQAGKTVRAKINSQVQSNQNSSLLKIALAGAGIALLPMFICQEQLQDGSLLRVLPYWSGLKIPVSIVSPVLSTTSARLSLVSSELATALKNALTE